MLLENVISVVHECQSSIAVASTISIFGARHTELSRLSVFLSNFVDDVLAVARHGVIRVLR